jgi:DNA-binding IclR family transcriptional regulator
MATAGAPCRLSDVAAALDLPKSATHRLLRELCALGWMEQSGTDGPYALTLRFALLGHRVLQASRLPDLVQPVLDALAAETRELVRLTVATEQGLMWFASAQGAPPGLVYQPAMDGEVVLHATANGKAYLSTLSDPDALKLARRGGLGQRKPTARTIGTAAALREQLAGIRARGYAVAVEEAEPGITAVSVPIRPAGRPAIGTISVAGPSLRIGPERIPVLAEALCAAATTLGSSGQALMRHRGGMQ